MWNLALGSQAKAHAPKRFQPSRRPPRQQLLLQLLLHAPAICFSGGSRLPFARPQTPQTLPQASKATTLTATCPCHLFFRGFTTSLPGLKPSKRFRRLPRQQLLQLHCSYYMPLPSVFQGVQDCRLPGLKPPKRFQPSRRPGNNSYSYYMPLPSVFQGVQDCRLPALKPPKPSRRPPRQQLLQLHAPAIDFIFQGVQDCRLPGLKPSKRFRRLPRQQLLQLHTCPCHLFFRGFKPALTPSKRSRRPPRQPLLQLHAPAICFSGGSRLPFARPQTPQTLPTLPQASKATTLTATTCPCHLFFRGFKTAVCPASNPPNASNPPAGLQGNNSYSYYMPLPSVFQGVQDCRLPALKPPKPSRRPPRQQLLQLHAPAIDFIFQGVQDCRLPGLKPSKRFRRLPRQQLLQLHTCPCHLFFRGFKPALTPSKRSRRPPRQPLLQLHAPAICFSGGSRQVCLASNPPHASAGFQGNNSYSYTVATTCPCHLFFRGFKTAVCPPSNPPNPPAGLQGNNSYSYMPLPSVFQGVHDKFAWPQTLQTLPQASKATTLTATL